MPKDPGVSAVAASRLNIQRRMHPQIANLLRATLYPYLRDHESTKGRKPVPGMSDRIWWLDHQEPEDLPHSRHANPNSFSNTFEIEMTAGLVEYLVSSNEYNYKDITVLTPYNGQLAAFNERFKSVCSLWLSEKDRESLLLEGYLDVEDLTHSENTIEIGNMLKLATIDNFQGEESKVVILSTVRSNSMNRVGFLKTSNRINVGCSRARDGFYIIGNSSLMGQVAMWQQIIDELKSKGKIGPYLRICCARHSKPIYRISEPEQWYTIPKCKIPCGLALKCGHTCPLKFCHADVLHERYGCTELCNEVHQPCQHPCTNLCGDPCGECNRAMSTVKLDCGHEASVTCADMAKGKSTNDIEFEMTAGKEMLSYGHQQNINIRHCQETCDYVLDCQHKCQGKCHDCRQRGHPPCQEDCNKELRCHHKCASKCHKVRPYCSVHFHLT